MGTKKNLLMRKMEPLFDPKRSVLPSWLIRQGIGCVQWDTYNSIDHLLRMIKDAKKEGESTKLLFKVLKERLDKKMYRAFFREHGYELRSNKRLIKELKEEIKSFQIIYFNAQDVEKAFREMKS